MPVPSPRNAPLAVALLGRGVVDPEQPLLHADDAGVLRGRAAFETMRVYDGVPFRLDAHLARLVGSAEVLGLPAPDPARLAPLALEAVAAAAVPGCVLRVVWTGGREAEQDGVGFALVTALPDGLERQRERGVALASLQLAIGAHARRSSPWLLPGREVDQLRRQHGGPARGAPARGGRCGVRVGRGDRARGADVERVVHGRREAVHARARPGHPGRGHARHPAGRRGGARDRGGGGRVCDRAAVRGRTRCSPARACAR